MYSREFIINNKKYSRVDKRKARGLYNKGLSMIICADNINPAGIMGGIEIDNISGRDFDLLVNEFEFYNCVSCETGYHTAFYMEVKKK